LLTIDVPREERFPDHEMLEAHRQFVKKLKLSGWRPIRCTKPYGFDGWKGSTAYELDWGEGGISKSMLKVVFNKLVLGKSLSKLNYYVLENPPGLTPGRSFYLQRREALRLSPSLKRHGILVEVKPVRRLV
jgi:hypothetical protein